MTSIFFWGGAEKNFFFFEISKNDFTMILSCRGVFYTHLSTWNHF